MLNSLFRYEGQRTAEALTEYVNSEAGKLQLLLQLTFWTILSGYQVSWVLYNHVTDYVEHLSFHYRRYFGSQ
jgi:hypothetical protein